MTFSILQLSWRGIYWQDLDGSNSRQNSILVTIQFVAKFHEICIVASLSSIALDQIQSYLVDGEGLPFGLMTSAYQISSITYLWSWQFWGGIFERDLRQTYSRRIRLCLLVVLTSLLAAVAGPSSAIILLPRLDWWPVPSPVLELSTSYIGNETSVLWPRSLTADHLPSISCMSPQGYQSKYCPSAGRAAFGGWDVRAGGPEPNLTIPITDSNMVRYLTASNKGRDKYVRGYSRASTVVDIAAKSLSCMWDEITVGLDALMSRKTVTMNRPILKELLSNGEPILKPLVATQCRSHNATTQDIEFPHDPSAEYGLGDSMNNQWKVPKAAWNSSIAASDATRFSWVDLSSVSHPPSIAFVAAVTLPRPRFPHEPDTPNGTHRAVIACTADAWWVPVRLWIDPNNDNSVHDDLADIVSSAKSNAQRSSTSAKITINLSWANALNVKPKGDNQTVIEAMITPRLTPLGPLPKVEDTISYLLGLHIAEGIARVHASTNVWHFPMRKIRAPPNRGENATCVISMCNRNHLACGRNLEEEAAASNFTKINFKATRYGYGWGLKGTAIKLANAALLLHAALCFAHTASSLWRGRTYSLAKSIGEMIALAMNSAPTEKLKNTCAGIKSLGTWKKNVVVRETTVDRIELIFEDGSDDEQIGKTLKPGKRYG